MIFFFSSRRRHTRFSRDWSSDVCSSDLNPAFVTLTGGSIGFQAGVQSSDIVLVFRSERGVDSIVNGKFTLGADAGVARSEERRVGKECRYRGSTYDYEINGVTCKETTTA